MSANAAQLAKNLIDGISSATNGNATTAAVIVVNQVPFKAVFDVQITAKIYENLIITRDTGGQVGVIARASLLQDIKAFGFSFADFDTAIISKMTEIRIPDPVSDLESFSEGIANFLQPKELMRTRVTSAITLNVYNPVTDNYERKELDHLTPIMAYPVFDDPMFRNLQQISQEFILPNIDKVPPNSITLLETNQSFIEAYMAGLNHEMSRELLWREFPTDRRGTYFRQFWDVSDNIREIDPEKRYDIKKMNEWEDELGDHSPRVLTNPTDSPYLVLLIRGELLKKYPNTQIYAQKAAFKNPAKPDNPRKLSDASVNKNIKLPVFMAELNPDIYLFAFDLDLDEAKGNSKDATKPGWFFVMRERPGQIRFGLDVWTPTDPDDPVFPTSDPANWNDLSWEHLVNSTSELENYHLDATYPFTSGTGSENIPLATWGKNSADIAYILYQNPVLFARHAQEMLPE